MTAKKAVEQGKMEKISFRPMTWGDINMLQCMFNDHSGFGATDLSYHARQSDQHFALVGMIENKIVGLITATVKIAQDRTLLDIKPPFIPTYLYRQAEMAEDNCTGLDQDDSADRGDLSPETKLTHEFKLAMIAHAQNNNNRLERYKYGLAEGPIFREIPTSDFLDQQTTNTIESTVRSAQAPAANMSPP